MDLVGSIPTVTTNYDSLNYKVIKMSNKGSVIGNILAILMVAAILFWYSSGQDDENPVSSQSETIDDIVPKDAEDIVDLGNGYLVFTMEIDGKDHRILFHRSIVDHGYGVGFESMTIIPK